MSRSDFIRPITLAMTFTIFGETLIFLLWGLYLFPGGVLWHKAVWTSVCGIAMGATIGSLVNLMVTGRLEQVRAAEVSSLLYFVVLAICTFLCFQIDLATGSHFGAQETPALFILGGLIPAFVTSFVYAWLLHSTDGTALLSRLGY